MSHTKSTKRPRIIRPLAGGLYQSDLAENTRLYRFRDYSDDSGLPAKILIGRRRECHLCLSNPSVSGLHAYIERRAGDEMWLCNVADCYVDGHPVRDAILLLVGMTLRFGDVRLIATDDAGRFPISVYKAGDIHGQALDYHRTQRRAAHHIGVSHTTLYRYVKKKRQKHKRRQRQEEGRES